MEGSGKQHQSKHLTLETMHGFLADRLAPQVAVEVEVHLKDCTLCASALENIARDTEADASAGTAAFAAAFRQDLDDLAPVAPQTGRSGFWRVAAAVLLALNIGWAALYMTGGGSGLKFEPYPVDVQKGSASESGLTKALQPYQKADYAAAIALLEALPDDANIVERKLLYLGTAFLGLREAEKALAPLERLVANPDWLVYRADARKYLELAYRELE